MHRLERYCLEHDLSVQGTTEEIQQRLIADFGCRVRLLQPPARRMMYLRFRVVGTDDAQIERPTPGAWKGAPSEWCGRGRATGSGGGKLPQTLPPRSEKEARAAAVHAIVARFIEESCVVDGAPGVFLDIIDRAGPDGAMRIGFHTRLQAWCAQRSIPCPQLQGRRWSDALPQTVLFKDQLKAKQVFGLNWLPEGETNRVKLSPKWHAHRPTQSDALLCPPPALRQTAHPHQPTPPAPPYSPQRPYLRPHARLPGCGSPPPTQVCPRGARRAPALYTRVRAADHRLHPRHAAARPMGSAALPPRIRAGPAACLIAPNEPRGASPSTHPRG